MIDVFKKFNGLILSVFLLVVFGPAAFAQEAMAAPASKNITVIGTGYVGLVLGAGLSEWGHQVICADIMEDKIRCLQGGVIPIYEPGLKELVDKNAQAGRLTFTTNIPEAISAAEIIFIAVGTPSKEDGSADLSALDAVAKIIGKNLNNRKVVCIKSTIPIGTARKAQELILMNISSGQGQSEIAFNPEFFREGSAVEDFFKTDRVVIGAESAFAKEAMQQVYAPLTLQGIPLLETNLETAEAIKYASNSFLAVKISFINEFANLCDAVGADVSVVAAGMGLDKRINPYFLNAGPGYGGSCFPKDTLALLNQAQQLNLDLKVIKATVEANEAQHKKVTEKLEKLLGDLSGKNIAVLGLAFKANTDDVRSSPAMVIIQDILAKGGIISAYDPIAMSNMQKILPNVRYSESVEDAVANADALIIMTEWEEFKKLDLAKVRALMANAVLLDAKNLYAPEELCRLGFKFDSIGRPYLCK